MRTSGFTFAGVLALNLLMGCGGGPGDRAAGSPNTGETPASIWGTDTASATPTSVKITGSAHVDCTFIHSTPPYQSECKLLMGTVVMDPPLAAGAQISDYLGVNSQSSGPAAQGWTTGLTVTSPNSGTCLTKLQVNSEGYSLGVSGQTAEHEDCGFKEGGVVASDFSGNFKANLPHAIYFPDGSAPGSAFDVTLSIDLTIE